MRLVHERLPSERVGEHERVGVRLDGNRVLGAEQTLECAGVPRLHLSIESLRAARASELV
jgi:hypothetical protein